MGRETGSMGSTTSIEDEEWVGPKAGGPGTSHGYSLGDLLLHWFSASRVEDRPLAHSVPSRNRMRETLCQQPKSLILVAYGSGHSEARPGGECKTASAGAQDSVQIPGVH
ncbi:hypothetical protein F1880_009396 [Penicillium rolfsii]|nr:hypothetical protein F1880_009396 [Penicillium rolfsii]